MVLVACRGDTSAGGGLRVSIAGKRVAAMSSEGANGGQW
jgi:hypothetical protein